MFYPHKISDKFALSITMFLLVFSSTTSLVLHAHEWQWQGNRQYIDFRIVNQLILLEGEVDTQKGYFILDTGAAEVLLNKARYTNKNQATAGHFADAKGKTVANVRVSVEHFQLAGFEAAHFSVNAFDMQHLEKWLKQPLLGIVGYDLFKNLELVIDYPNQVLQVYRLNWRGQRKHQPSNSQGDMQRVETQQNQWSIEAHSNLPVEMPPNAVAFYGSRQVRLQTKFVFQNHLPVLKAKVGKQVVFLGIDTGAGAVVMNQHLAQQLPDVAWQDSQTTVYSTQKAGGVSQKGQLPQFQVASRIYADLSVVLLDLSNLQDLYQIDGLLGYDFWKNQVTSINFKTRQLTVFDPLPRTHITDVAP